MDPDRIGRMHIISSNDPPMMGKAEAFSTRERLQVVGMELSLRALEAPSLEELQFLLTNDMRALISFDRCSLVTHFDGVSEVVTVNNQPILQKKAQSFAEMNKLASCLRGKARPVLLSAGAEIPELVVEQVGEETMAKLAAYMESASCSGIMVMPLNLHEEAVAHLIFEYFDDTLPDQDTIVALVKLAPAFASALGYHRLIQLRGSHSALTERASLAQKSMARFATRYVPILVVIGALLYGIFFLLPVPYSVGGEAEVVPRRTHIAFSKTDGLVQSITVAEGATVKEGEVLAILDPTELDFKIGSAEREIELLENKAQLLVASAGQDISKLAESKLVELNKKSAEAELEHLKWQRRFLDIKAPRSGIVVTKHIERLVGKKFSAGEPFCEIAVPEELRAEIRVPEERISEITLGLTGNLYLNTDPLNGHGLRVTEIAPRADALPRLGNIYRVRASFYGEPPPFKVGMKGIGKIEAGTTKLWYVITDRLGARWNSLSLYFW